MGRSIGHHRRQRTSARSVARPFSAACSRLRTASTSLLADASACKAQWPKGVRRGSPRESEEGRPKGGSGGEAQGRMRMEEGGSKGWGRWGGRTSLAMPSALRAVVRAVSAARLALRTSSSCLTRSCAASEAAQQRSAWVQRARPAAAREERRRHAASERRVAPTAFCSCSTRARDERGKAVSPRAGQRTRRVRKRLRWGGSYGESAGKDCAGRFLGDVRIR